MFSIRSGCLGMNDCRVSYAMSEPTHGEDDRPSGGRCVAALSRPAIQRMQEHDRYRLAGGCGIPNWKSSILRQDDAYAGANGGVPARYGRRKVSKSDLFKILHPAIGNLRKQSIDLHPSVGSFKRDVGSEYLRY